MESPQQTQNLLEVITIGQQKYIVDKSTTDMLDELEKIKFDNIFKIVLFVDNLHRNGSHKNILNYELNIIYRNRPAIIWKSEKDILFRQDRNRAIILPSICENDLKRAAVLIDKIKSVKMLGNIQLAVIYKPEEEKQTKIKLYEINSAKQSNMVYMS